ncbi:MAG: transcriptional repressor [Actinobacteria bacterium]|nr:transcriptional repressor [Actinomycetota bacterium]
MVDEQDIAELLRERGHRVTRPRRAVWDVLRRAGGHLTAEEIAERVHGDQPGVNLASVYRSLALFSELSLARESRLGDAEASRWELAHPDEHFHLVCQRCGDVDHHVGTVVAEVREHLRRGHGFLTDDIELTVTGTCADCIAATGA